MSEKIKLLDITTEKEFGGIVIKKYINFSIKKVMISNILESAKIQQDGLTKIDYAFLKIIKDVVVISQYSNIEIEDDIIYAYDYLKENKIIEYIFSKIDKDEIAFIDEVLKAEIEQIYRLDNSIENILSKTLNNLIAKFPNEKEINKIIKEIPKSINKIKPETLEIIKNINK